MKHRFLFSILSVFVFFSLILSNSVFAEEVNPYSTEGKVTRVGTVNIQNAKIVSQKGNTFEISFEMSNREIIQSGVKYGVKLVSKTKDGQVLADEKVYDESIYLPENTVIRKDITYVAPSNLSGTYSLVLFGGNTSGFSFGISYLKDVTLVASAKGFEIVTNSCYLKVEGDKSNTHYSLLQNVDIGEGESLRLTCNTINNTSNVMSLTPTYETRYRSPFGDIVPVTGGDVMPIAFKATKNESFSVVLPKGPTPQMYNLNFNLKGPELSNTIGIKYLVRGLTATITNLSFNKDYYGRGEQAVLTLLWAASSTSDKFLRGDNTGATAPVLSAEGVITNSDGGRCSATFTQTLTRSPEGPKMDIPVTIISSCLNPQVTLTIKDDNGTTLDQKDFSITTTVVPEKEKPNLNIILMVVLAIIAIIVISIILKKKNQTIS